jgi:ribosomal protein L11 methyltransferase
MDHYQFLFENISPEQKDLLIALLGNVGFNGFEEEAENLKAFIETTSFSEAEFNDIIEKNGFKYSKSTIYQTNWNQEWESGFSPVIVPDPNTRQPFAAIRAGFHEAIPGVLFDLVITPKMSFGTGHHATTWLMIQRMSQLDITRKTVIDFGTGTGVLAILAEKLGASTVIGIDNDDWSIRNAQENILANHCSRITLQKAETISVAEKADIILANINLNVIIANLDAILSAAKPGATFLFSGVLTSDHDQLVHTLAEKKINIEQSFTKDNWLAICAKG